MKKQEIINIYKEAFEEYLPFEEKLFGKALEYVEFLEDEGTAKSILFLLPCTLDTPKGEIPAKYIFAAATKATDRKKGYMEKLLERIKNENSEFLFLRPASQKLEEYYKKIGFQSFVGTSDDEKFKIKPSYIMEYLSEGITEKQGSTFVLMYYYKNEIDINKMSFIYSME